MIKEEIIVSDDSEERKNWVHPLLFILNINGVKSNFNDTIVDNETGSSGS
jgi:hypothetical protein